MSNENNNAEIDGGNEEEEEIDLLGDLEHLENNVASGASVENNNNNSSQNRRRRTLNSQPTFEEDVLDNEQLNRQQQFEEDMSSSDEQSENADQLFEEYIRQNNSRVNQYNTELPIYHSYLGDMDVVSGRSFFEVDKTYQIPICGHHSLVFPGEILPMIMSESIFENEGADGLIFGLVFWENTQKDRKKEKEIVYGVSCQVYEKGVDQFGHITLKSRALQRFQVVPKDGNLTTSKFTEHGRKFYAHVKILPEIVLPDPILSLNDSNNLRKFLSNPSQYNKIKDFIARSFGVWPKFVYDQYEIVTVMQKVERFLAMLNMIEKVPTEPVALSFWLARNIPLTQTERQNIFISNCVTSRMLIIGRSLNFTCKFCCKRCKNQISIYKDIFAMSKNGIQTNFCNPAGYIHETLTVYKILENSLRMTQPPSTEFSWFPGYAWQIAVCENCSMHIGWKFIAVNRNLKPKNFFGLSGKSITVETNETKDTDDQTSLNSDLDDTTTMSDVLIRDELMNE